MSAKRIPRESSFSKIPWFVGAALFAAIATFFLWEEHRAHILGALPYVLLLACPLLHLFMHRGHDHGGGRSSSFPDDHSRHHGGAA